MTIAAIEHIAIAPDKCHGAPHIAGTRIRVQDIVMFQRNGWSVDEIVAHFDYLTLAQVHAALAYYYDHQSDIDAAIEQSEQVAQQPGGTYLQALKARLEADNKTKGV
jgi:uncharacterized protein (DUF433 family)